MQMRSAREAQRPEMEQEPVQSAEDEMGEVAPLSTEGILDETASGEIAEQETMVSPPPLPDDLDQVTDATMHSYQADPPPLRRRSAHDLEFATPRSARDLGESSALTISPNAVAGLSYLFLWITGALIFFGERRNRYVRFHALQSILFGTTATFVGVVGVVGSTLLIDLGTAWKADILSKLGVVCAILIPFSIVVVWWLLIVAAWNGDELTLPILGRYAKHYAAPSEQPHV